MIGRDSSSDAMNTSFHIRKKKTVQGKEKVESFGGSDIK